MSIIVVDEWDKQRCYLTSFMSALSLYGWYRYSLFDQNPHNKYEVYHINCLVFLLFLCYDTYKTIIRAETQKRCLNKNILAHHIVSFIGIISKTPLQTSHTMISLCCSSMDYKLRDDKLSLVLYRASCIIFIRIPVATFFLLYYNPTVIYSITKISMNNTPYSVCFICYDLYTLYGWYSPNKVFFQGLFANKLNQIRNSIYIGHYLAKMK